MTKQIKKVKRISFKIIAVSFLTALTLDITLIIINNLIK